MFDLRILLPEKGRATKAMRTFAEEEISSLTEALGKETLLAAAVVVKVRNNGKQKLELSVKTDKNLYRREVSGEDYYDLLPLSVGEVEKQVFRNRKRLLEKRRKKGIERKKRIEESAGCSEGSDIDETSLPFIKYKRIEKIPLSVEDAICVMENIGHDFYVFENNLTGQTDVVYKRSDGGYGVIQ